MPRPRRSPLLLGLPFALLAVPAFAGCGSGSVGSVGNDQPTFSNIYTAILEPACANHHSGGGPSGNLDMSSQSSAYGNLVGVKASGSGCGSSGQTRVVAGNASASLLYNKVNGTQTCGGQMPLGGPYLPANEVALIQTWINGGAPNN